MGNRKRAADIGLIEVLATNLGVSVAELLAVEYAVNSNRSANMKKIKFYVCPICCSVIQSIGEGSYTCCGIMLPLLQCEDEDERHQIEVNFMDNDYYVHMSHPMTKAHYISFLAYATSDSLQFVKLYPEQNIECRFARKGHGPLFAYCNQHGLFTVKV